MQLINATKMMAGYTMGVDPTAREHIVVVVKGTFRFPARDGETAELADKQAPLVMADTFTGEPGFSAPIYEADFPLRKPRCDVLLNATAHAPEGRPAERVRVGVKLGGWTKVIDVVGDRYWTPGGGTLAPSAPIPFVSMPLTYDRAHGGVDDTHPEQLDAYRPNPIGRGFGAARSSERLAGRPVANTEAPGDPVRAPWGDYRPMALGPLGRGWQPRLKWAGTYDQHWLDDVFPFLPADFDDRYHQSAPDDQQIDPPRGGEEVVLVNLTSEGRTTFRLPQVDVPVVFFRKQGGCEETTARLDTIVIEPNLARILLTWRASLPLKRNIFEIPEALVGRYERTWWDDRERLAMPGSASALEIQLAERLA